MKPVWRTQFAVVIRRELVTPDVVALTLADAQAWFTPVLGTLGGHIDVQLPSGRRRQCSLCGTLGRRVAHHHR